MRQGNLVNQSAFDETEHLWNSNVKSRYKNVGDCKWIADFFLKFQGNCAEPFYQGDLPGAIKDGRRGSQKYAFFGHSD